MIFSCMLVQEEEGLAQKFTDVYRGEGSGNQHFGAYILYGCPLWYELKS